MATPVLHLAEGEWSALWGWGQRTGGTTWHALMLFFVDERRLTCIAPAALLCLVLLAGGGEGCGPSRDQQEHLDATRDQGSLHGKEKTCAWPSTTVGPASLPLNTPPSYETTSHLGPIPPSPSAVSQAPVVPPPEPEVLELLAAVLRQHRWSAAEKVWLYLERAGLYPIESPAVAGALRGLISHAINPLFASTCSITRTFALVGTPPPKTPPALTTSASTSSVTAMEVDGSPEEDDKDEEEGVFAPVTSLEDFPAAILPLLQKLGPYLADDVALYVRLVRLYKVGKGMRRRREQKKRRGGERREEEDERGRRGQPSVPQRTHARAPSRRLLLLSSRHRCMRRAAASSRAAAVYGMRC